MKQWLMIGLIFSFFILLTGCVQEYPSTNQPTQNPPKDNQINEKNWFSIEPIQCRGNAWEQWHNSLNRQYVKAPTEEEILTEWLSEVHHIEIEGFASKQVYEAVCEACDCPRGDIIAVLVDSSNSEKLIELGWKKMEASGCQEDAKVCSDGSVMVREAPFCEFPECE